MDVLRAHGGNIEGAASFGRWLQGRAQAGRLRTLATAGALAVVVLDIALVVGVCEPVLAALVAPLACQDAGSAQPRMECARQSKGGSESKFPRLIIFSYVRLGCT